MQVHWVAAFNGGTHITEYEIEIRAVDGVAFFKDEIGGGCDGTQPEVVANKECSVLVSTLLSPPFDIPYGSSIYARVKAHNIVGSSEWSEVGNDAVILSVPSQPTNLVNVLENSDGFQIALRWFTPEHAGGVEVLDYRILSDEGLGTGEFIVADSSCKETEYVVQGLTPGLTYTFTVAARNIYGYGSPSEPISVLAAQEPFKPSNPMTYL